MRDIPDNSEDILDSRDIEARIDELDAERGAIVDEIDDLKIEEQNNDIDRETFAEENGEGETSATLENEHIRIRSELAAKLAELVDWDASDEAEELKTLKAFRDELDDYCDDWSHGVTLIRDSYFKEYTEQLADDIGAINGDAKWPVNCIDWDKAARELQMDYTSGEFDGVTYWAR